MYFFLQKKSIFNKQRPKFGVFRTARVTDNCQVNFRYNNVEKRRKLNDNSGDLVDVSWKIYDSSKIVKYFCLR